MMECATAAAAPEFGTPGPGPPGATEAQLIVQRFLAKERSSLRSQGQPKHILEMVAEAENSAEFKDNLEALSELYGVAVEALPMDGPMAKVDDLCDLHVKHMRTLCEVDPPRARDFHRSVRLKGARSASDSRIYVARANMEENLGDRAQALRMVNEGISSRAKPLQILESLLVRLQRTPAPAVAAVVLPASSFPTSDASTSSSVSVSLLSTPCRSGRGAEGLSATKQPHEAREEGVDSSSGSRTPRDAATANRSVETAETLSVAAAAEGSSSSSVACTSSAAGEVSAAATPSRNPSPLDPAAPPPPLASQPSSSSQQQVTPHKPVASTPQSNKEFWGGVSVERNLVSPAAPSSSASSFTPQMRTGARVFGAPIRALDLSPVEDSDDSDSSQTDEEEDGDNAAAGGVPATRQSRPSYDTRTSMVMSMVMSPIKEVEDEDTRGRRSASSASDLTGGTEPGGAAEQQRVGGAHAQQAPVASAAVAAAAVVEDNNTQSTDTGDVLPQEAMSDCSVPLAEGTPFLETPSRGKTIRVNGIPYTRLQLIGRGGSSKVFLVKDARGVTYALKRVDSDNAKQLEAYRNEVTLLQSLKDREQVIQVLNAEVNEAKGRIDIVMEQGDMDLGEFLKARGDDLSLSEVRQLWRQMLEAVQVIHKERIVHTDLKPANFLIVGDRLKVIDFGIAKRISSHDTTNISRDNFIGTLSYMPPEAVLMLHDHSGCKHKISRASDVWALGIILFQMVYRRAPFAHLDHMQRIVALSDPNLTVQFPEEHRFSGSSTRTKQQIQTVLAGCLHRNPRSRVSLQELLFDPLARCSTQVRPEVVESAVGSIVSSVLRLVAEQGDPIEIPPALDKQELQLYAQEVWEHLVEHGQSGRLLRELQLLGERRASLSGQTPRRTPPAVELALTDVALQPVREWLTQSSSICTSPLGGSSGRVFDDSDPAASEIAALRAENAALRKRVQRGAASEQLECQGSSSSSSSSQQAGAAIEDKENAPPPGSSKVREMTMDPAEANVISVKKLAANWGGVAGRGTGCRQPLGALKPADVPTATPNPTPKGGKGDAAACAAAPQKLRTSRLERDTFGLPPGASESNAVHHSRRRVM